MMIDTHLATSLQRTLAVAIADRPADVLLLSGGVDSSALLGQAVAGGTPPRLALTVSLQAAPGDACPVHGDALAVPCNSDHDAARDVATWLDVPWQPIRLSQSDALDALVELCLALRSFDLGNLNNIALYVGAINAARIGAERVWTGDDADSLFGAYRYLSDEPDWRAYLARRIPTIRPTFTDIASVVGVKPVYPWLHPSILDIARSLDRADVLAEISTDERPAMPSFMDQFDPDVQQASTRQWGKIPVRQLAAMHVPDDTAWRPKTDLEFGSGMCALERPLAADLTPDVRDRIDTTGIRFFNDAHRGLYQRFVDAGGRIPSPSSGQYACMGCGGGVDTGRRHCPTCGAWPADQR